MSHLIHQRSDRRHPLAPVNLIGRSPTCDLCLPATAAEVSRFHALIYWSEGQDDDGWWVRDLNSRNGTFIDGARLDPGREVRLAERGTIAFGARRDTWALDGTEPPPVVLIGHRPDHEIRLTGRALLLPHDDTPEAIVYHRRDTGWVLETDRDTRPLDGDHPFTIAGTTWRAIVPRAPAQTRGVPAAITLVLTVSRDEEYVELCAERGGRTDRITAGNGSALYFLLALARRRLDDATTGEPETEQGWIHTADAAREHKCSEQVLNQWVFRIRARLAAVGLDELDVIERRARTGLLRLGHPDIRVVEGMAAIEGEVK